MVLEFIIISCATNVIGLTLFHVIQEKRREQLRRDVYLAAPSAVKKKLRSRLEYKKLNK